MTKPYFRVLFFALIITFLTISAAGQQPAPSPQRGRPPVIIVPGLIGSELVNEKTGEVVWFELGRSKDDDLRLPISIDLRANRDNLVPRDILREIQLIRFTPKIEVYQKLIDTLKADGFVEGKLDAPVAGGEIDTFYVFPYDWRRDNVENAQLLLDKLDVLRLKLDRPNLKFNVIAHSMGGLIARYAAMYGRAEPVSRTPRPTWKGASYFNSLTMIATPNGGATSALESMINGFSLFGSGKINLPFIQNLERSDLFTLPAVYQLLPHSGTIRAFDEELKPLKLDIYDPAVWEEYGWVAYGDPDFGRRFSVAEQLAARDYFRVALKRAERFQTALDAASGQKDAVPQFLLGADCRDTLDGVIIRREKNIWKTDFAPVAYTRADGVKVSKEDTQKVLLAPGDGVVAKRSLLSSIMRLGRVPNANSTFVLNTTGEGCVEHNRLAGNESVTRNLLDVLNGRQFNASAAAAN